MPQTRLPDQFRYPPGFAQIPQRNLRPGADGRDLQKRAGLCPSQHDGKPEPLGAGSSRCGLSTVAVRSPLRAVDVWGPGFVWPNLISGNNSCRSQEVLRCLNKPHAFVASSRVARGCPTTRGPLRKHALIVWQARLIFAGLPNSGGHTLLVEEEVCDVAVDLRWSSSTFGKREGFSLGALNVTNKRRLSQSVPPPRPCRKVRMCFVYTFPR